MTTTPRRAHVPTLSDFTATTITGEEQPLETYAGKVALVVNTASECGFTPQFEGLEKLHSVYADEGLVVLGFPCNQFGNQDPGDNEEIGAFCEKNYGVTFPMFEKVDVNGDGAHPLYQWLRREKGGVLGDSIKWNFTKFLVGRDGTVLKRYGSTTTPEKIVDDIEKALAA
jgi:glutathione peroxidase